MLDSRAVPCSTAGACATASRFSPSARWPRRPPRAATSTSSARSSRRSALTENPAGIEDAEEAALELQRVLGAPPTLATPARLDAIGVATRRLELALGGAVQGSPFAVALKSASEVVDALLRDVEGAYRGDLR